MSTHTVELICDVVFWVGLNFILAVCLIYITSQAMNGDKDVRD